MILTTKQLEEQQVRVFIQNPMDTTQKPRLIKFPKEVDTDLGTVQFYTVPPMPLDEMLEARPFDGTPPPEVDHMLNVQTVTGQVILLGPNNEQIKL